MQGLPGPTHKKKEGQMASIIKRWQLSFVEQASRSVGPGFYNQAQSFNSSIQVEPSPRADYTRENV